MTQSLQTLCEHLIDYSGFALPAGLPMGDAVRNYGEYLGSENRWLLARSILPLTKVSEYEAALSRETASPWHISALTTGDVKADIEAIDAFNNRNEGRAIIDAIELKAESPEIIRGLRTTVPVSLKAFVEIPLTGDLATLIAALAANGFKAKARTGGLTANVIPSCEQVARFLVACAAARISCKFTAGMHAPFRSVRSLTYAADSPKAEMHGFINTFVAATLAWAGGDMRAVTKVLEETDPLAFQFDDERALVHDHRLATEQIAAGRKFARSLGSCSFVEPVEGLRGFPE